MEYVQDASGNKLRQLYYINGNLSKTTDFIGSFVYENGLPAYILYDEGRVVYNTKGTGYFAEAYLKDQLGNVRVAFRKENGLMKVRQVDNYYPFGLNIKSLTANSDDPARPNEYLYNGKQLQDEMGLNWLDYGARFYDPVLGRFHSIDNYADSTRRFSPYHYGSNNPMRFIDIMGDSAWSVTRNWSETDLNNFASYAGNRLKEYEGKNIDCANLALSVLIDYASENGLPLKLSKADGTTFDSNSDKFNSVDDYKNGYNVGKGQKEGGVLPNIQAVDIASNSFEVSKSNAQTGDMIILTKPHDHIVNISQTNPIRLTYGNIGKPVTNTADWTKYRNDASGVTYTDSRGVTYQYNPNNKTVHRWNVLNTH